MRMRLGSVLVCLWIVATGFAFWQFQGRYLLPVTVDRELADPQAGLATVEALLFPQGVGTGGALINFWNPHCGCSQFAESHVRDLALQFGAEGVQVVTVIVGGRWSEDKLLDRAAKRNLPGRIVVDADQSIVRAFDVLAAPAAVIVSAEGEVVYRGAYNISRTCTDEATAHAKIALQQMTTGNPVTVEGLPFYGCANALN